MHDVTYVVEGTDLDDVVRKLEQWVAASLRWTDNNAVRFETPNTKAISFSRRRRHRHCERGSGWEARPSTPPGRRRDGWRHG